MDPNGGFDPNTQGTEGAPLYATPQSQFQQAPVVGQDVAYGKTPTGSAGTPVPQVTIQSPAVQPMEDARPGWQQDIQYSAPADPPWIQDPSVPNYSQVSALNTGVNNQAPISPDAYNLLLEPVSELPRATGGGKKSLVLVVGGLIVIMLVVGAAMISYTTGYNKGLSEGKAQQPKAVVKPEDESETETDTSDEYKLEFETSEPLYNTEKITGVLAEQLEASDGLVVMATSVDRNFSVPDLPAEEDSELEFVRVNLLIGNADSKREKIINDSTFSLVDSAGAVVGALRSDLEFEGKMSSDLTVASGGIEEISLLFEVTKDQPDLTLLRKQTYKVSGETRTLEMLVTLEQETTMQS